MKKFLTITLMILFLSGFAFASGSDDFFCIIQNDVVNISLKKTEGYIQCNAYVTTIERLIVSTAQDLITIHSYIMKNQDVDYRNTVKTAKIATFNKLQLMRTNMIASIKAFDGNVFKKTLQYFILKITPYKIQIIQSLKKLNAFTGEKSPEIVRYSNLLSGQLIVINAFPSVTTKTGLNALLAQYIYLKTQIQGK